MKTSIIFKQKETKEQKNSLLSKRKYLEDRNGFTVNQISELATSNQEDTHIDDITLMFSQFISDINQSKHSLSRITIRSCSQKKTKIES